MKISEDEATDEEAQAEEVSDGANRRRAEEDLPAQPFTMVHAQIRRRLQPSKPSKVHLKNLVQAEHKHIF